MWNKLKKLCVLSAQRRIKAFSLLEVSIVLLIMGVVLSFSLPYLINHLAFERHKQTSHSFEEITHALASFVMQHGRLPYPASPQIAGQNIGMEDESMVDGHSGIVPFRTLGLSQISAKDGYGHWIRYTPHPSLIESISLAPNPHADQEGGSFCTVALDPNMRIMGNDGANVAGEDALQPAFVLISHGKKGGDVLDNGSMRPLTSHHPCKVENSNGDLIFKESLSKECDDKLFWKSRQILLSAYAKAPCPAAQYD